MCKFSSCSHEDLCALFPPDLLKKVKIKKFCYYKKDQSRFNLPLQTPVQLPLVQRKWYKNASLHPHILPSCVFACLAVSHNQRLHWAFSCGGNVQRLVLCLCFSCNTSCHGWAWKLGESCVRSLKRTPSGVPCHSPRWTTGEPACVYGSKHAFRSSWRKKHFRYKSYPWLKFTL